MKERIEGWVLLVLLLAIVLGFVAIWAVGFVLAVIAYVPSWGRSMRWYERLRDMFGIDPDDEG